MSILDLAATLLVAFLFVLLLALILHLHLRLNRLEDKRHYGGGKP